MSGHWWGSEGEPLSQMEETSSEEEELRLLGDLYGERDASGEGKESRWKGPESLHWATEQRFINKAAVHKVKQGKSVKK